ncbi:hypothetical protein LSH36_618g01031, partial [Paralvinella palmiformis]
LPTKSEDEMGQATPELIITSREEQEIAITGQGFMGQYTPLSHGNLAEKLTLENEEWIVKNKNKQRLTELRLWGDRVRNFDRTYVTDNGVFYIDCSGVHDFLLTKLDDIFNELCMFVADEASGLAKEFSDELINIVENMKQKDTDIAGFAIYAKNVSQYKKNTMMYQQRIEYIKSLFEQSYSGHSTTSSASTPLRLAKLSTSGGQYSRQNLDSTQKSISRSSAVSPVDGTGQGSKDLQLRDSFYNIQKQLEQGSKWREAIIGEPCDLTFLHDMSSSMTVRQQLWRYVEVSQHAIMEWKQTLFVKFNCHKAMDKILEWQATGEQLKDHIPSDDQPRHWRTIFLGIGEQYDADMQLTVNDLLSYNLQAHIDVINHVYKAAITEYSIEHRLANISKFWSEREFKLAKHIPDSVYKKGW